MASEDCAFSFSSADALDVGGESGPVANTGRPVSAIQLRAAAIDSGSYASHDSSTRPSEDSMVLYSTPLEPIPDPGEDKLEITHSYT